MRGWFGAMADTDGRAMNMRRGTFRLGVVLSAIWLAAAFGRLAYKLTDNYLDHYWIADTILASEYWTRDRPGEAKPWADVASNAAFQALPTSERDLARRQYLDEVVMPRVPKSRQDFVRGAFLADTERAVSGRGKAGSDQFSTERRMPVFDATKLFAVALLPIAATWSFCLVCWFTIRWVIQGFAATRR